MTTCTSGKNSTISFSNIFPAYMQPYSPEEKEKEDSKKWRTKRVQINFCKLFPLIESQDIEDLAEKKLPELLVASVHHSKTKQRRMRSRSRNSKIYPGDTSDDDSPSLPRKTMSPEELEQLYEDPISFELMADAVIAPCKHTFSSASITAVLSAGGTQECPICRRPVVLHDLKPNWAVRECIRAYLEDGIPLPEEVPQTTDIFQKDDNLVVISSVAKEWSCEVCTYLNPTPTTTMYDGGVLRCAMCDSPSSHTMNTGFNNINVSTPSSSLTPPSSSWSCTWCTFLNTENDACEVCGAPRGGD